MSRDKWQSLTSEEQQLWDQLSPQAKATILGIGHPPPPHTPHQLSLHDISAADYVQLIQTHQQHLSASSAPTASSAPPVPASADSESPSTIDYGPNLLACATQQSTSAHPGDLRRVLGQQARPKPTSSKDIVIDGQRYRGVNTHHIVYDIAQHRASRHGSLVDRGANGGLAGSCLLYTSPSPRDA